MFKNLLSIGTCSHEPASEEVVLFPEGSTPGEFVTDYESDIILYAFLGTILLFSLLGLLFSIDRIRRRGRR